MSLLNAFCGRGSSATVAARGLVAGRRETEGVPVGVDHHRVVLRVWLFVGPERPQFCGCVDGSGDVVHLEVQVELLRVLLAWPLRRCVAVNALKIQRPTGDGRLGVALLVVAMGDLTSGEPCIEVSQASGIRGIYGDGVQLHV